MSDAGVTGDALLAHIAAGSPSEDRPALWWLGHSGFVLRWHDLTVVMDPYLSNYLAAARHAGALRRDRLFPAPLEPRDLAACDVLTVSSGQPDHFDAETVTAVLKAASRAVLVLPEPLADHAADELRIPDERLVPISDGEVYKHEGLEFHAVPAARESFDGLAEDGRQVGYVVQAGDVRLYHAGDTVPSRRLGPRLRTLAPQVALVPISGRDAQRQALGHQGSLTIAEAARLAAGAGVDVVAPMHYGLFDLDGADPASFEQHVAEHHEHLKVERLGLGKRWVYAGDNGA
ncbi:MAG: MBL fold metallo-hydrolase [Armatimonadetes bacterium]|nr:MBL fold metallo-hydrolase [Armatimonadota bacterium]